MVVFGTRGLSGVMAALFAGAGWLPKILLRLVGQGNRPPAARPRTRTRVEAATAITMKATRTVPSRTRPACEERAKQSAGPGFPAASNDFRPKTKEIHPDPARLPSRELRFRSRDLRRPSRDLQLPSRELGIPSRDLQLPSRDLRLPSRDLRLPSRDLRLPSRDLRLPLGEL